MPGKYLSMAKFIALEEQGNVEVFRQGVRDADARIEARRWVHAFAVAHVEPGRREPDGHQGLGHISRPISAAMSSCIGLA